ncbi:MAG: hypothetical protein MMC33_010856, partial [Icmadophila ericetorum]|nr:hypothetical protein [Icmadophila ericetorum]
AAITNTGTYTLEYDSDSIKTITEDEINILIAHEMIYNWSLMGESADSIGADENVGVANYYFPILLQKFSMLSAPTFLHAMNNLTSAYYTNPMRALSNKAALEIAWDNFHAQRLPYARGFTYLVKVNPQILKASNGKRSVDDIMPVLLQKRLRGEPFGADIWLDLLTCELGPSANPNSKI